jgi:hypothetical protein
MKLISYINIYIKPSKPSYSALFLYPSACKRKKNIYVFFYYSLKKNSKVGQDLTALTAYIIKPITKKYKYYNKS